MNNGLPQGWAEIELRECVDVLDNERVPVNSDERAKRQGDVPYYGATGQVGWIDEPLFNEELLLIGEDGAPFFDKSKPISYIIRGKSWVNNHAHVLRARPNVSSNQYLKHFLDSFDFHEFVNGTTRLKLTQGAMNRVPVRLAPLGEQRRMVAKLEKLSGKVDACQERLAKIPVLLKRFRQSVLAAACSGRLTADWREEKGLGSGEWSTAILNDVADLRLGKMLDKAKNVGQPTRYLRNINVRWFSFDLNDLALMRATANDKCELSIRNGDLLVCEGGEPGRCAVWRSGDTELIFQKAIHRVRTHGTVASHWVALNIRNDANSGRLDYYFTGTTIKHLTGRALARYELPLPPVGEQQEIVRRVEALFALADEIEARYAKAKAHVEKLTQSILAKAFRGELVPQDPNDEPAEALLSRIRPQRKDGKKA